MSTQNYAHHDLPLAKVMVLPKPTNFYAMTSLINCRLYSSQIEAQHPLVYLNPLQSYYSNLANLSIQLKISKKLFENLKRYFL